MVPQPPLSENRRGSQLIGPSVFRLLPLAFSTSRLPIYGDIVNISSRRHPMARKTLRRHS